MRANEVEKVITTLKGNWPSPAMQEEEMMAWNRELKSPDMELGTVMAVIEGMSRGGLERRPLVGKLRQHVIAERRRNVSQGESGPRQENGRLVWPCQCGPGQGWVRVRDDKADNTVRPCQLCNAKLYASWIAGDRQMGSPEGTSLKELPWTDFEREDDHFSTAEEAKVHIAGLREALKTGNFIKRVDDVLAGEVL